jgi:hypothetical protein
MKNTTANIIPNVSNAEPAMHPVAQLARNWSLRVGSYLFCMTVDPSIDPTVIAQNGAVKFAVRSTSGSSFLSKL